MSPQEKKQAMTGSNSTAPSALVTGSSRGIGKAIATTFAQQGYNICINYASASSQAKAEALALSLNDQYGVKAIAVCADISQSEDAQKLIDATKEALGSIDVLVNNAGISRDGLLVRTKEEDFDAVLSINLKGAFNCCKAASSVMMKQRFGRIINMGSVVGLAGNVGQTSYAASKAGLVGLSKSIAKELAPRNITVNVVAPGFIETDMTDALSDKQQQAIQERIASKRYGKPEDVATLVCFLASKQAGYITGQVIGVDGGISL